MTDVVIYVVDPRNQTLYAQELSLLEVAGMAATNDLEVDLGGGDLLIGWCGALYPGAPFFQEDRDGEPSEVLGRGFIVGGDFTDECEPMDRQFHSPGRGLEQARKLIAFGWAG